MLEDWRVGGPMHLALHMAKRFIVERENVTPGNAMAALRERIILEDGDQRLPDARALLIIYEHNRLASIGIEDMPPSADDLALLLETAAFAGGFTTRADVWRSIGIDPERGRAFFTRNAKAVDWPIWFTLRHAALGE